MGMCRKRLPCFQQQFSLCLRHSLAQPKLLPDGLHLRAVSLPALLQFKPKGNTMNFFTETQYAKLLNNGRPENRSKDHYPVVKLFLPGSYCVWLLTEIDPCQPEIAFGLCDLGLGHPELGYVSLGELSRVNSKLGLGVERDDAFEAKFPISVYASAAQLYLHVVEHGSLLKSFAKKSRKPI